MPVHHAPWRPFHAPTTLPSTKAGSARRLIVWQALYRLEPLALLIHQRHQADWNLQREASHSSAADCSLSLIQTALMEALRPGAYLEYHAAELGDIVEPLLWRLFSLPVACMQGSCLPPCQTSVCAVRIQHSDALWCQSEDQQPRTVSSTFKDLSVRMRPSSSGGAGAPLCSPSGSASSAAAGVDAFITVPFDVAVNPDEPEEGPSVSLPVCSFAPTGSTEGRGCGRVVLGNCVSCALALLQPAPMLCSA